MGVKEQLQELEDMIAKGLEEAYRKMVKFKKQKNSPLIVSRKGKVIEIKSQEILPNVKYKR